MVCETDHLSLSDQLGVPEALSVRVEDGEWLNVPALNDLVEAVRLAVGPEGVSDGDRVCERLTERLWEGVRVDVGDGVPVPVKDCDPVVREGEDEQEGDGERPVADSVGLKLRLIEGDAVGVGECDPEGFLEAVWVPEGPVRDTL